MIAQVEHTPFPLMDAPRADFFEGSVDLLREALSVPVALVSFFDTDKQFFMAARGLPEPLASQREGPRDIAICRHVAEMNHRLVIDDAVVHPLVKGTPPVTEGGVGAYLGYPLHDASGNAVGALCAIDATWRHWRERDHAIMQQISQMIDAHIRALKLDGQPA